MIVAVASGKGGTGKTTVSAALAKVWPKPTVAVDLDVEEPNLHLFLQPQIAAEETADMQIPEIIKDRCTYCRACSELCQFKAIAVMGEIALTFPEMCHGCGGCFLVCPESALKPVTRELGTVSWGRSGASEFLMGRLRVGEAMSPPLMRAVKRKLEELDPQGAKDVIIDAPPGVSCPAVNAVMDSDVIVLVTEPTPFGLYDLGLAREAFVEMGKPMGVVVNRAGIGDRSLYDYCRDHQLDILAEIPYSRKIAEAYSKGQVISEAEGTYRSLFQDLARQIQTMAILPQKEPEAVYD
jgi:MinD superfamily P-loop ATPase